MSIGFLVQKSALISSQTQTTSLSYMYKCVCVQACVSVCTVPQERL